MADRSDRVKARLPRGLVDRSPEDIRAVEEMTAKIREVYERYGFEPVETPLIEYTDALGKFLPDQDRPNEGVFSFQDDDEQWLSLRYDLTAPLARYVAENFERLPKPYRSYRSGWVFRNEKPGPGRFRQFMQFDADTVGAPSVAADAEMCMMMADVMEALGIKRGDYVIRVNNRKVLDGVLEARGIKESQKLSVLRSLDKFDKFGRAGVLELLTIGRKDESGDFTAGAGLDVKAALALLRLFETPNIVSHEPLTVGFGDEVIRFKQTWAEYLSGFKVNGEPIFREDDAATSDAYWTIPIVLALADPIGEASLGYDGIGELLSIYEMVQAAGYDDGRIRIDASVVRGLEYYTGPVYEAELLAEIPNEHGVIVRFGSVGGGGRYDGLVKRFTGQDVPATGFSIGVSRLVTALKNLGELDKSKRSGPVVVTVMERDRMADYQRMAATLRAGLNGPGEPIVPVEVFMGNPKQFGKQLQYADRRGSPCVVIQGGDERAAGEVQIKDLVEGKRLSEEIEDNKAWRESRPAQFSVPEGDLVAAVRKVLDAQAEERSA